MPRKKRSASTALAIRRVQLEASSVLSKLRRDIRSLEIDLAQLKRDEESLGRLAGRGGAGGGGRINWRNVLAQLPKQFKASNVRQLRGLKDKRPSEIFAAITRWIDAGLAKRKTRGVFQRVGNGGDNPGPRVDA